MYLRVVQNEDSALLVSFWRGSTQKGMPFPPRALDFWGEGQVRAMCKALVSHEQGTASCINSRQTSQWQVSNHQPVSDVLACMHLLRALSSQSRSTDAGHQQSVNCELCWVFGKLAQATQPCLVAE